MTKYIIIALALAVTPALAQKADTPTREKAPQAHGHQQPGAHKVNPAIRLASREALLEKYDANKNGHIDTDELEAIHKDMEARKIEVKAEVLAEYDKDGDGKISKEERQAKKADAAAEREAEGKDPRPKGKGKVRKAAHESGKEGACVARAARLALVEKFDANANKKLDQPERKTIKESVQDTMKAKKPERKGKRGAQ